MTERGAIAGQAITGQPWAMLEADIRLMWEIVQRDPRATGDGSGQQAWRERDLGAFLASGKPVRLEGSRYTVVTDGIAVIPVFGPIFPRANMVTEFSGGTSAALLKADIGLAVESAAVGGIMLVMDTPGGAVSGINAVADALYRARDRKPVVAHVSGAAASAGYWIATSAGEITMERTGLVGSIGVATVVPKQVEPGADGRIAIDIVSSNAPDKWPDPTTEEGAAEIRRGLDAIEAAFIADVARGRGVTPKVVREQFGRGGIEIGQAAVEKGMADRVTSYEQSFGALKRRVAARQRVEAMKRAQA